MPVEPPVCGGLDVHTDPLPAWRRRVDANGQVRQAGREGATPSPSLLACSDWRIAPPGPVVAMASTGVSGKPVEPGLAGTVAVCLGHAPAPRRRPGQQTATREAAWSAALVAHGRRRPRVVPPPEMCAVRVSGGLKLSFSGSAEIDVSAAASSSPKHLDIPFFRLL
jgi:hypothetical protein